MKGNGNMSEARKGMLLVISGASGTGKGTVIKELMAHDDSLVFSVSATTRSPRPGEENGREYYFISEEEFARRVENDEFIEYAPVFAHHYGTLRSEVSRRLAQGQNVVLDIDVQGAEQVIAREKDCVSIFILPPSRSCTAVWKGAARNPRSRSPCGRKLPCAKSPSKITTATMSSTMT